ncbi:hypothetical protein Q4Q34_14265 [Flavivirga abyssicola]|uniref:hypothetical protein n=1 Tax=Flavivirga abyssicola TaxID=3063533 RepID=UPI0026DFFF6C|nr:hypothetical protein [Flavivirga sp. MEBiC07777]WVK12387.1 hypothetical protein Q4Q34_14265 [Flavivirga sp. MEBiC07777]
MKEIKKVALLLVLVMFVTNCASVKLADSWNSENFDTTKTRKILVVARDNDMGIRSSYEKAMVLKLKEKGVDAIAAFELFPDLKEKNNRSQEEIDALVRNFKSKGINAIMLTALKDTKIEESLPQNNSNNYISTANIGKYGISFTDYYNMHSIEYISRGLKPVYNDNQDLRTQLSSTTYILEAVVYDLALAKKEQLVGVFEIEATDPSSGKKVLNKFTTLISKQFKQ